MAAPRKAHVVDLDVCPSHCDEPTVPLDALRGRVSGREAHVEAAELFRLLGDPTRLAILHALLEGGELCVCDLARVAGVAENVVSQAMRLLRASDVVRTRRDGRRIHYRLADAHVQLLLDGKKTSGASSAALGYGAALSVATVLAAALLA